MEPAKVAEEAIEAAVARVMDLTPRGIREHLTLNMPIYQRTAAYGHSGVRQTQMAVSVGSGRT